MSLIRRHLIGLAGASVLGLTGCAVAESGIGRPAGDSGGGGRESARCVPWASLTRQTTVAGRPLVYEISRRRSGFWFDDGFHTQLETWFTRFVADTDVRTPGEVWAYGSWTNGEPDCDSWHNAGLRSVPAQDRWTRSGVLSFPISGVTPSTSSGSGAATGHWRRVCITTSPTC